MTTGNKLVIGLAVGMCAGALTGMLLAPRSGRETRKVIKSRAGELGSRTRRLMARRKATA